jgi:hypothetical protein
MADIEALNHRRQVDHAKTMGGNMVDHRSGRRGNFVAAAAFANRDNF